MMIRLSARSLDLGRADLTLFAVSSCAVAQAGVHAEAYQDLLAAVE